jgi:two-component system phosphate regulon response regulator PhoB
MTDMHEQSPPEGPLEAVRPLLTPTERRLFDVLRGQAGRTFTRAELIALIMPGVIVLERTIDVHVKGLRSKLGAQAGAIQTVRGVGYCFVPPAESYP